METCLKLFDPIKTKNELYFAKLVNNDEEFTFQTQKTKLILNKEKGRAKILLNSEEIETIVSLADQVTVLTSDKSTKWFNKSVNYEECKSIYKDAVLDSFLHCFYDDNTIFFNSKGEISKDDIDSELTGIALLNCIGVVYTKTSFFLRFEISQFKVKSDKKVNKDYLIKDLEEHHKSLQDENIIKKLEDITLF